MTRTFSHLLVALLIILSLTACATPAGAPALAPVTGNPEQLTVVATTTLVADVVKQVAGDQVNLITLIPPDVDEHGFEPTPRDIAQVAQADLVMMNGAGLESFIEKLMQNAGGSSKLVSLSDGITLLESEEHIDEADEAEEAEEHAGGDPHVWTDPNNVIVWVDNVEKALSAADPTNAATYQANAEKYRQELRDLDGWISQQVDQVPEERRKLVTDHTVFTYFANRYGFEQIGAIVPGYSTLSAPSAKELAGLEDAIRQFGVPAIFVGNTVNPSTAERVSTDTQTQLVHVLTGSLTAADGPAPTYIDYMRYNVEAIVKALR